MQPRSGVGNRHADLFDARCFHTRRNLDLPAIAPGNATGDYFVIRAPWRPPAARRQLNDPDHQHAGTVRGHFASRRRPDGTGAPITYTRSAVGWHSDSAPSRIRYADYYRRFRDCRSEFPCRQPFAYLHGRRNGRNKRPFRLRNRPDQRDRRRCGRRRNRR